MLKIQLPKEIHKQKNAIANLPIGGDSLFIANLTAQIKTPILYIVNDGYQLQRLQNEINLFAPHLKVASFPAYEVLPYERQSPYNELVADRLKTLWYIQHNQIDVLLIQATTAQTYLPPKDFFAQRVLLLQLGATLDIDNLRKQLSGAGYECVNQVYEAGEFAIRGSIIDIMPMGSKQAVRIDLFDDEIESLQWLDVKSQMVTGSTDNIEVLPSREYPHDSQSLKDFIARFKDYFPKAADSALIKDIAHGMLPAGVEFYLPFFYAECATIFDYLGPKWQIVYHGDLLSNLNQSWQEINKRYELYSYQYPCIKPIDLFLSADKIFSAFKSHTVWEVATSGEYFTKYGLLPDVAVDNKAENQFNKVATLAKDKQVVICASSLGRLEILRQTLTSNGITPAILNDLDELEAHKVAICQANLYQGFSYAKYLFVTEGELYPYGRLSKRKLRKNSHDSAEINSDLMVRDLAEIAVGDLVVHVNHGIGQYNGLTTQQIGEMEYEMIEVLYQDNSKLFIPVHNLHLISRYSHLEGSKIELTKLGSKHWDKIKAKAEQKVNDVAAELLELYAKRELQEGSSLPLPSEYGEFAASFGYDPTSDQQHSFDEIIKDLAGARPMDRLICGDVGFGKTEVAMRAAFIAAMNGYQVAILAPTTLLTEQLYQNIVNRFAGFPITVGEISRFKTKKEITETLQLLESGKLDIVIGTHRLIQDDVKFARLGLVIIDEEHRFGVKQKEKLKHIRQNVDILTMTATPIPRTLSMALDGLRDFSIIATAPSRRLPVNTLVVNDDKAIMQEAILREIRRGGQVFFLYNDVATIEQMYNKLLELMPELRIAIAHGQMPESQLEQTIKDFVQQRYNLLLCSTIIETGIDIPNANTILIYRADKFGLAQLHQLRGRVGRSHHQAYCYLIVPENVTKDAEKRLDAILHTSELGAGFNLAMHDLEIRGAGEILGDNQAGNIKEVGLSLYTQMLKKAIRKLKNSDDIRDARDDDMYCEVSLNTNTILPVDYCESVHERLIYYKRLANAENVEQLETIYQEIIDRYGLPPDAVKNLFSMHQIRLLASKYGIQKVDVNMGSINLLFIDKPPVEPVKIILLMQTLKTCKYDGKSKLIWLVKSENVAAKISNIEKLLGMLE